MRTQCVESDIIMMLRIKSMVGKLGCHVPPGTLELGSAFMSSKENLLT